MAVSDVFLGTDSTIGIGAEGEVSGGTFTDIGGLYTGSMSWSHDAVDTTCNDDSGFTSAVYGNTTVTLSFEGRFDPSDAAQATLRTAALTGKTIQAFRVRPIVGNSEDEFFFDGVITSFELNPAENNTPINFSCEVQSTGAATFDSDQTS